MLQNLVEEFLIYKEKGYDVKPKQVKEAILGFGFSKDEFREEKVRQKENRDKIARMVSQNVSNKRK